MLKLTAAQESILKMMCNEKLEKRINARGRVSYWGVLTGGLYNRLSVERLMRFGYIQQNNGYDPPQFCLANKAKDRLRGK